MMTMSDPVCPKCHTEMTFVMEGPEEEMRSHGAGFTVPLASNIYRCDTHGHFRVYISGAIKDFPGQVG